MGFRELIKTVQIKSGFSDKESKEALELMVESLAVHLTEGERKDFASQLPHELKDMALSVYATKQNSREGIIEQFMRTQGIEEDHAKKQIHSAWDALKEALTRGQINHIRAQLPDSMVNFLH